MNELAYWRRALDYCNSRVRLSSYSLQSTAYSLLLLVILAASPASAALGPDLVPGRFWVEASAPRLEDMDPKMLERLGGLGIVQQLRDYPDSPIKEATTVTLIQAPPDRVWKVLLDVTNRARMVPEIYTGVRVVEKKPNELITEETFKMSVSPFSWDLEGRHRYRIDREKLRVDFEMIEGKLTGSKGRLTLVPARDGQATILVFRHYVEMRNNDLAANLFLTYSPQFGIPANMAEGVALVRGARREAGAGLDKKYLKPPPWAEAGLEVLDAMSEHRLYIHQEKPDQKPLGTAGAWKIAAPPDQVWNVVTDFEKWDQYQKQVGVKNTIVERKPNQVKLVQKLSYKIFYIFGIDLEIEYDYKLEPKSRLTFTSPDPKYPDTHGEWLLLPADNGKATYLLVHANINIQNALGASNMFGEEAENPMPVQEPQNMMGIQILGAPIAERLGGVEKQIVESR